MSARGKDSWTSSFDSTSRGIVTVVDGVVRQIDLAAWIESAQKRVLGL